MPSGTGKFRKRMSSSTNSSSGLSDLEPRSDPKGSGPAEPTLAAGPIQPPARRPSSWETYLLLSDCLRRCLSNVPAPLPPHVSWEGLIAAASHHFVTPALSWCLRAEPALPGAVRRYLEVIAALNRERNAIIHETLVSSLQALNAGGISPVLLKGIASLASGLYPDIRAVNEARAAEVVNLLEASLRRPLANLRIAVLGLAFKPDTDDTRELAGLRIAGELARRGADVIAHDPMVTEKILRREGLTSPALAPSLAAALAGAHAAIIATSWGEYRAADWPNLAKTMKHPLVLDGRQVIEPAQRGRNFVYAATGTLNAIGPDPE